ncbi:hypothetical protein [Streptomyces sp. NPDC050485]|uniref:hypothetical protein n=1 Tax=Streptomyces sp. NPDC050485 TaxID=3365617 RepID=UPI00378D5876
MAITPTDWSEHYTSGQDFRGLGDEEKDLLAVHAPPPDGGRALDVGCGVRHEVARGEWIRLRRPVEAGIAIPG